MKRLLKEHTKLWVQTNLLLALLGPKLQAQHGCSPALATTIYVAINRPGRQTGPVLHQAPLLASQGELKTHRAYNQINYNYTFKIKVTVFSPLFGYYFTKEIFPHPVFYKVHFKFALPINEHKLQQTEYNLERPRNGQNGEEQKKGWGRIKTARNKQNSIKQTKCEKYTK